MRERFRRNSSFSRSLEGNDASDEELSDTCDVLDALHAAHSHIWLLQLSRRRSRTEALEDEHAICWELHDHSAHWCQHVEALHLDEQSDLEVRLLDCERLSHDDRTDEETLNQIVVRNFDNSLHDSSKTNLVSSLWETAYDDNLSCSMMKSEAVNNEMFKDWWQMMIDVEWSSIVEWLMLERMITFRSENNTTSPIYVK